MEENYELESIENNRRTRILVIGALIGALTGLGAAYLLLQRGEKEGQLDISAGEGVKLGLSVFGFLRQVTQLGQ
jgi:hypothetical protein